MKQNCASPDALQFYTELQQLTSVAACADLFKQTVAKFGIYAFACGEIDLAERDRNVMFIAEWPKAWVRYYLKSGLVDSDPILNSLQVAAALFRSATFAAISDSRTSTVRWSAQRLSMDGLGLAVPISRGGTRFGLVTLIGRGEEFEQSQRSFLCLISECLLLALVRARGRLCCAGRHEQARNRGGSVGRAWIFGRRNWGEARHFRFHRSSSRRARARPSEGEDPRAYGRALRLAWHRRRDLIPERNRATGDGLFRPFSATAMYATMRL